MTAPSGTSGPWSIILAGGGGSRLRGCTVDSSGHHVPKQFCVVDGRRTLLQLAIARAERLVDRDHVVVVVSSQHRKWWKPQLAGLLPPGNVVVQPLSRGTAVGVLLPLLRVLAHDADAHVVLLPADHHFRHEDRLARVIRVCLDYTHDEPSTLAFVGVEASSATSDFGYIVPRTSGAMGPCPIAAFHEKPPPAVARDLVGRGALWNTLIFAVRGQYLLQLIRARFPHTVDALRMVASPGDDLDGQARALAAIYPGLTNIDLSADVLQHVTGSMAVTPAIGVGWSELGTPDRVFVFWDEIRPSVTGPKTVGSAARRPEVASALSGSSAAGSGEISLSPPE